MERDVFDARIRGIFDGLGSGAWPFLKIVVIPRTSEGEHKLYLYLREIARQGFAIALPEIYLYNLLQSRSPEVQAYGLERTQRLKEHLEGLTGRAIQDTDLANAVADSNQAREAVRGLLSLRHGAAPRLTGTEALPLIGAMYFMDRAEYAELAKQAVTELSSRPPLRGARLLVKGSPLNHTGLHQALEAHDAVVVAEDDWWGSRSVTKEIPVEGDQIRSIFETYYLEAPSPRESPSDIADGWFLTAAANVDGVIFYLPPEDDVLGWDYPRLRKALEQREIPSLLVREDAFGGLSSECHELIEQFVSSLAVSK
jgi:benzoyl-CoA reductase/2-hydroxyglutaryl-CoA dehydratase subunit BcrC/BadD/HgdB